MSSKVALIYPGKREQFAGHEPLHLGFLAGYLLIHGVEVKVIDELSGQSVKKELDVFQPDIVGITATTPLAQDAYRIGDMCRKEGIFTIIGGVHASIFPNEALAHADAVVVGEGEKVLLGLVRSKTRGIFSGSFIERLDELPHPARELLQMEYYLCIKDKMPHLRPYISSGMRVASLLTSRGCPYSCVFCWNSKRANPVRCHSAEWVFSEVLYLKERYKIDAFFFIEDNFFVYKKRVLDFCRLMIENKIDLIWGGSTRVDNVELEMLKIAYKAGCRMISFGFESGSQRILDVLKKNTTVQQAKEAVRLCREAGIIVNGSFMIGNPTETLEDIKMTHRFVRENKITMPAFFICTPYPGTVLWEMAEKRLGRRLDWSDFDQERVVVNFSEIPTHIIERLRNWLYIAYFLHDWKEMLKFLWMSIRYPKMTILKFINSLSQSLGLGLSKDVRVV